MPITHKNRLRTTISNTPGASGALTISTASSGYRTFATGDDGLTFDVVITDGTAWEVRTDCTYTHSGTSLSRGTLEDSSTGSAITLTSAAVVTVTATAGWGNAVQNAAPNVNQVMTSQKMICSAHLSTNSASSTAGTTVANKLYFSPFLLIVAANIDGLGARVGTGVAATSIRLGIYECGSNGHPGALLRETSALSAATSGTDVIGSITSISLRPGWYYTGIATEGAPAMGRIDGNGNTAHILGQDSGNLMISNQAIRVDHTFGALPNPAPTTSLLNVSTLSLPTVFMRAVA